MLLTLTLPDDLIPYFAQVPDAEREPLAIVMLRGASEIPYAEYRGAYLEFTDEEKELLRRFRSDKPVSQLTLEEARDEGLRQLDAIWAELQRQKSLQVAE